jgi:hypothetical protein
MRLHNRGFFDSSFRFDSGFDSVPPRSSESSVEQAASLSYASGFGGRRWRKRSSKPDANCGVVLLGFSERRRLYSEKSQYDPRLRCDGISILRLANPNVG